VLRGLQYRASMLRQKWRQRWLTRMHEELRADTFGSGLGESAWLLYGLARSLKPRVCVEIGSAQGKSACYIGAALRENGFGKLYAIDPHTVTDWNDADAVDSYRIITHNIKRIGVGDHVEIVRESSAEVAKRWDRPIDLLFIDGDHSYDGVRHDWEAFSGFLTEFGVTIFHDTIWDIAPDPRWNRPDMGVPRFVEDLRQQGYPVVTINQDFGVSLVQGAKAGVPLTR
jgi:predicted O-methyltransferase YrrM